MRLVGVDGCRGGWVVAARDGVRVVGSLADVLHDPAVDVVGIDMPIGLPHRWGRRCDDMARALLGPRRSSLFDTPPRPLLDAVTFEQANQRSRATFGRGLSRQTFHLLPKIREVDALVSAADEARVLEVHPESSFTLLAGEPLPPKRTEEGIARRRALIVEHLGLTAPAVRGARADDVLDALAVLWTVERYVRGEHRVLGDGERDERGLLMRIVT